MTDRTYDNYMERIRIGNEERFKLEQRIERLEAALRALTNKLRLVEQSEHWKAVWSTYYIHGGKYEGPTYKAELLNAEQALEGE